MNFYTMKKKFNFKFFLIFILLIILRYILQPFFKSKFFINIYSLYFNYDERYESEISLINYLKDDKKIKFQYLIVGDNLFLKNIKKFINLEDKFYHILISRNEFNDYSKIIRKLEKFNLLPRKILFQTNYYHLTNLDDSIHNSGASQRYNLLSLHTEKYDYFALYYKLYEIINQFFDVKKIDPKKYFLRVKSYKMLEPKLLSQTHGQFQKSIKNTNHIIFLINDDRKDQLSNKEIRKHFLKIKEFRKNLNCNAKLIFIEEIDQVKTEYNKSELNYCKFGKFND
jgi:hypothetical protein